MEFKMETKYQKSKPGEIKKLKKRVLEAIIVK